VGPRAGLNAVGKRKIPTKVLENSEENIWKIYVLLQVYIPTFAYSRHFVGDSFRLHNTKSVPECNIPLQIRSVGEVEHMKLELHGAECDRIAKLLHVPLLSRTIFRNIKMRHAKDERVFMFKTNVNIVCTHNEGKYESHVI
jgi:hypothetical protein